MKKTKAFTLTELLVVMIVSTIVISMAFVVLTMVKKQLRVIRRNLDKKQTIEQIDRVLWKDFNESNLVYFVKDKLVVEKEEDTLFYTIKEKMLIREKDSFPIQIKTKSFFLDGLQIEKGSLDAMKLEFESTYTNQNIFVFKRKDASFYLNTIE